MRESSKRFLTHLSISALAAVATPAIAAGLVVGTQQAVSVADSDPLGTTSYAPTDIAPAASDVRENYATHAPTRLSPLAGTDKQAWESAHAVHVRFEHKQSPTAVASR